MIITIALGVALGIIIMNVCDSRSRKTGYVIPFVFWTIIGLSLWHFGMPAVLVFLASLVIVNIVVLVEWILAERKRERLEDAERERMRPIWEAEMAAERAQREAELERIGAEGDAAWAAAVKDAEEKKAIRYKDRVRVHGEQRAAELTAEYEAKGIEEWMRELPALEPLSIEAEFARLLGHPLPLERTFDEPAKEIYLKIEQAKGKLPN
jgi:uncharacterized membrane protein